MTSIEREKMEAMARKAKVIRDVWLREREQARAVQITANAEIRRGWKEFDYRGGKISEDTARFQVMAINRIATGD